MFVWPREQFEAVSDLVRTGLSDYEVARRIGVPRSTVQKWRVNGPAVRGRSPDPIRWRPSDDRAYCYALGLYLGDGHIVVRRGRPRHLRLCLDALYPQLIAEAQKSLEQTFPPARAYRYVWGEARREIVQICHPALLTAFPQHGPGRKHERPIKLVDWQVDLTRANPAALIRGLIHSDGCRSINRFTTKLPSGRVREYAYPRYFFTNRSADIIGIFRDHCALIGVRTSMSNPRNVSVSDKKSVAILDQVVGPKR